MGADQEDDEDTVFEPYMDEAESKEELKKFAEMQPEEQEEEKKFHGEKPTYAHSKGKHHKGFYRKHKDGLKEFTNWLDKQSDMYGAQNTVRAIINAVLFFGFIWACVWIAI